VIISSVDGFPTDIHGDSWVTLADCGPDVLAEDVSPLSEFGEVRLSGGADREGRRLFVLKSGEKLPSEAERHLEQMGLQCRVVRPIFFPVRGEPIFRSASEVERYAEDKKISLAEAALDYETSLLGISRDAAMAEMARRYSVMKGACERGLGGRLATSMQLLRPTAQRMWEAGMSGKLPFFGLHSRAAIRAVAVMHANGGMDVVCAAPTGGSAGALPGAVITLEEELGLSLDETCMALWAAGAIGLIIDARATFAAEVAGCQVEIGAGGAMASAACVYAAHGSVRNALDAAAIAFQNTMGSICDPVQGMVEIPCHTRNASAAAGAFVNADLILGGYENDIPLDETIDAVYEVGGMLPPELRCTSLGGLSMCPSALAMKRLR
jgi:L-serine dehydratase